MLAGKAPRMKRRSTPAHRLERLALDGWENEGGALGPGQRFDPASRAGRAVPHSLSVRTWSSLVMFDRPFILDGFGHIQPAGAYSIETQEEMLDRATTGAANWRRTDTRIGLVRDGATVYLSVDPGALVAALHRDAAQSDRSSAGNTAKSRLSTARSRNPIGWR